MKYEFICQQCGNCCRWMGFNHITFEDRARWIKEGREDILKYVGKKCKGENGEDAYTWTAYPIIEKMRDAYKRKPCVFLTKDNGRYKCKIHETKPTVCKTFPASLGSAEGTITVDPDETTYVPPYCNGIRKIYGVEMLDADEIICNIVKEE